MKIYKLLQLAVLCSFVFACTKDTVEQQNLDETNTRIAQEQFDQSYLGVYKGLFTTNDGLIRGSVNLTLSPSNVAVAQITLSSGEIIELQGPTPKLTVDNSINNLRLSSFGSGDNNVTLNFSVDGDGLNPIVSNVRFNNNDSDVLIAKNLSYRPASPITGTYARTAGTGGFPRTGRTWNVLSIGTGNNRQFATQISYAGRIYTSPAANNIQRGCRNTANNTRTCNINGSSTILGIDLNWTGTHKYSRASSIVCSEVHGTWTAVVESGLISGTFDSDTVCN